MRTEYTDDELQAYRLRLCARMDVLLDRMPDMALETNEREQERWSLAFRAYYNRYCGIEDMLIERGVELLPLDFRGEIADNIRV